MPHGGFRPGAGRPRRLAALPNPQPAADIGAGLTPLQHMLNVLRDPTADPLRRDRMAIAAAPYIHPRISDRRITMKEQRAAAAKKASANSEWEADLAEVMQ
jgi:hypothetical protein